MHELRREIPPGHILADVDVEAVARRDDRDDVIFRLRGGPTGAAIVHLTYRNETDPTWPHTQLLNDDEPHMRDATASDRPVIERILVEANREFADGTPTREDIDALFARSDVAQVVLAEADGRALGCVAYFAPGVDRELDALLPEGHAYLGWLAVLPAHRRAGIGEALTSECIARARRDGARAVDLFTSSTMAAAMRLYERLGFVARENPTGPPTQIAYSLDL